MRVFQQTAGKRIIHGPVRVTQHTRQQPANCIDNHQSRQFTAG